MNFQQHSHNQTYLPKKNDRFLFAFSKVFSSRQIFGICGVVLPIVSVEGIHGIPVSLQNDPHDWDIGIIPKWSNRCYWEEGEDNTTFRGGFNNVHILTWGNDPIFHVHIFQSGWFNH